MSNNHQNTSQMQPTSTPPSKAPTTGTTSSDIAANLRGVLEFARAGVTGLGTVSGLEPVLNGVLYVWDMVDNMKDNKEDLQKLQSQLQRVKNDLVLDSNDTWMPDRLRDRATRLSVKFSEVSIKCALMQSKSRLQRALQGTRLREMIADVRQEVRDAIQEFSFQGGIALEIMVRDTQLQASAARSAVLDQLIRNIKYAPARFDAANTPSPCLDGTRTQLRHELRERALGQLDAHKRFIWIYGAPGTGKSTIAKSLAVELNNDKVLAASFFFSRDDETRRTFTNVFRTIAFQMAHFNPMYHDALRDILAADVQLGDTTPAIQLERLIIDPLSTLPPPNGLWVLIFDALDECADEGGAALLKSLCTHIEKLPTHIRIIFTSRPEHSIRSVFQHGLLQHVTHLLALDQADEQTTFNDIFSYLSYNFTGDGRPEGKACNATSQELHALAVKADGLFVFASTSVKFIFGKKGRAPRGCLEELLRMDEPANVPHILHELYYKVINDVLSEDTSSVYCAIMGVLMNVQEPVNIVTLSKLTDVYVNDIIAMLHALSALLILPEQDDGVVRIAHSSIIEYACSIDAPHSSHLANASHHHGHLSDQCLNIMDHELMFNICNIESSHYYNQVVVDLREKIAANISPHLSYSCRFWRAHLNETTEHNEVRLQDLARFMNTRLLFWFEVMSLFGCIPDAIAELSNLSQWCNVMILLLDTLLQDFDGYIKVKNAAQDAISFLHIFGGIIEQATPHIYISGIPFSPTQSIIYQNYVNLYENTLHVRYGQERDWPRVQLVLSGHTWVVSSVAFSPNEDKIASGSWDTTLRIWNAQTGDQILPPLRGHTDCVTCITFSPDGKRIISGSDDTTMRLWNVQTGEPGPIFRGHTDTVTCIRFSDDMSKVFSGSKDRTVQIWDSSTAATLQYLCHGHGHTDSITSIALLSSEKYIVTGSHDMTVKIWSTADELFTPAIVQKHDDYITSVAYAPIKGLIVSGSYDTTIKIVDLDNGYLWTLIGHTHFVNSIAISPDEEYVASGSSDKNVRLWKRRPGESEYSSTRLTGHSDSVTSISFSSNGTRIVSGSMDKTIRVWDTRRPMMDGDTDNFHNETITSVAFSPMAQYIVSGSYDRTMQVWDTITGEGLLKLPIHHDNWVTCVAFSVDGNYIASGSEDTNIRVYNVKTGDMDFPPFQGHDSRITCIGFSPDGKYIASGSDDETPRIWELKSGRLLLPPLYGHTNGIKDVKFSPDGTWIASASDDCTIRTWSFLSSSISTHTFYGHEGSVNSVSISPDGKTIGSGSDDFTVRLWSAHSGESTLLPLEGHHDAVMTVVFLLNGQYIASSSDDRRILIWSVSSGDCLKILYGHVDGITSMSTTFDGKYLASASRDMTLRIWGTESIVSGNSSSTLNSRNPASSLKVYANEEDSLYIHQSEQTFPSGVNNGGMSPEFTDESIMQDDGWVLGENSELLFWVPPEHRAALWRPSNTMVIGRGSTRLDFSKFRHGREWTACSTGQS